MRISVFFLLLLIPNGDLAVQSRKSHNLGISCDGFTDHFRHWLTKHDYDQYDFNRDDLYGCGGFGGKVNNEDTIGNQPVIFIHGNGGDANGDWSDSADYFIERGFKISELYGVTWGIPNDNPELRSHNKKYVMHIRKFIEAVLDYTQAEKVDIITFSMGVTLGRKAIKGGNAVDDTEETYYVGNPLTSRVDTFLGLGGLNRGTLDCLIAPEIPLCLTSTGFYPGILVGDEVVGRSTYLEDLLTDPGFEGDYRYALYSLADFFYVYGGNVYGVYTEVIPSENGEVVYQDIKHEDMPTSTIEDQFRLVTGHNSTNLVIKIK